MNTARRWFLFVALMVVSLLTGPRAGASECLREAVEAHVREQFSLYGPQSMHREYFGFVYLLDGDIRSAVVASRPCRGDKCVVDSAEALRRVPQSARVLGEWHTHPHGGSRRLSAEDVWGAYKNRHIRCYRAFYSTPAGEIYAWDPRQTSIPVAMASRAALGNYHDTPAVASMAARSRTEPMRIAAR
jgi:hypothetical protein